MTLFEASTMNSGRRPRLRCVHQRLTGGMTLGASPISQSFREAIQALKTSSGMSTPRRIATETEAREGSQ